MTIHIFVDCYWEFGVISRQNALLDNFLNSHYMFPWQCIKIVRRSYKLIAPGSQRVNIIPLPGKLIFSAGCLAWLTARLWHYGSSATGLSACRCRVVECPKHRGGEGVHGHLSLRWVLCACGYVLVNPVRYIYAYILCISGQFQHSISTPWTFGLSLV